MKPRFDADNNPRCPVLQRDYTWQDDNDERPQPGDSYRCDSELYVVWTFDVPLDVGAVTRDADVPADAVSSSWELRCTEGHVFAHSSNQRTTYDTAEEFDPSVVLDQSGREKCGG